MGVMVQFQEAEGMCSPVKNADIQEEMMEESSSEIDIEFVNTFTIKATICNKNDGLNHFQHKPQQYLNNKIQFSHNNQRVEIPILD